MGQQTRGQSSTRKYTATGENYQCTEAVEMNIVSGLSKKKTKKNKRKQKSLKRIKPEDVRISSGFRERTISNT
jgi:hypothetical protein